VRTFLKIVLLVILLGLSLVALLALGVTAATLGGRLAFSWMHVSVAGPIVFLGVVAAVVLFGLLAANILSGVSRQDRETGADEVRLMQELHRGLSGLEKRVESLETLLMERRSAGEADSRRTSQ